MRKRRKKKKKENGEKREEEEKKRKENKKKEEKAKKKDKFFVLHRTHAMSMNFPITFARNFKIGCKLIQVATHPLHKLNVRETSRTFGARCFNLSELHAQFNNSVALIFEKIFQSINVICRAISKLSKAKKKPRTLFVRTRGSKGGGGSLIVTARRSLSLPSS